MKQIYLAVQTDPLLVACPLNICCLWLVGEITNPVLLAQPTFDGTQEVVIEAIDQEETAGTIKYFDRLILPSEINSVGWQPLLTRLVEWMAAKAARECSQIELVLSRQDIPASSFYLSKFDASCLGSYLARCLSDYRRQWLIDEVFSGYERYNWRENRGRLTSDHAFRILEHGVTHLHINERLPEIGRIWEEGVKALSTETIMSRYSATNPPLWWKDLFPDKQFGVVDAVATGQYEPEFMEWLNNVRVPEMPSCLQELRDAEGDYNV